MNELSLSVLVSLLLIFIALSGFMAAAESGIMALDRHRLRQQAQAGHKSSRRILTLLSQPESLIGLIRVGSHLGNIAAAVVATLLGHMLAGVPGIFMATILLALSTLVFAEAGPRTFGARHPERIAPIAAFLLTTLSWFMRPVIAIVTVLTNLFFRFPVLRRFSAHELKQLKSDIFLPDPQQRMSLGTMALDGITVNDVMVPRGDVQGIDLNDDMESIIQQLRRTRHTRLPVYRDELNDCVGTLHIRNSTRFLGKPDLTRAEILQHVRAPYFVPEGTSLLSQLLQFQRLRRHFGLVVDEYGDVLGVITLEAILEEVVGKFTSQTNNAQNDIQAQDDGSWIIDGGTNVRDINRQLNWKLPLLARTLNGLILETLEAIPESTLSMKIGDYLIEILQIRDNAIKAVKIFPPEKLR